MSSRADATAGPRPKTSGRSELSALTHKRPAAQPPADALDESESGVSGGPVRKPGLDLEGRAAADRPQTRTCLACGKPFPSTGWANRLCNPCRQRGD